MANFGPIAQNGEKRVPSAQENDTGLQCGPLDQPLFNGMLHRIEAELKNVQDGAGIAGVEGQNDQVYQAIMALIAAAVGPDTAGDLSQFVLMDQARTRMLFYPEVTTPTNGIIGVTSPGVGTVRIPAGAKFLHRGIYEITTVLEDFLTDPNKVYHLRWNPTDGFNLVDVLDGTYNPGALLESNATFDSDYDDMLVARISTDNTNTATILNLVNKHSLIYDGEVTGAGTKTGGSPAGAGATYQATFNLNWARVPFVTVTGNTIQSTVQSGNWYEGFANRVMVLGQNRYQVTGSVTSEFWIALPSAATVSGVLRLLAKA